MALNGRGLNYELVRDIPSLGGPEAHNQASERRR